MIYNTGTIAINGNSLTGEGTEFNAPLSMIRIGCTLIALTDPIQLFTIAEITSATNMTVAPAAEQPIPAGTKYGILLTDSVSVDGMAQDVAAALKYFTDEESVFQGAIDFFETFDWQSLVDLREQILIEAAEAHASRDEAYEARDIAVAAKDTAVEAKDTAVAAKDRAEELATQLQPELYMQKGANLSDLADAAAARLNLGLGCFNTYGVQSYMYAAGKKVKVFIDDNQDWGVFNEETSKIVPLSVARGGTGATTPFNACVQINAMQGGVAYNIESGDFCQAVKDISMSGVYTCSGGSHVTGIPSTDAGWWSFMVEIVGRNADMTARYATVVATHNSGRKYVCVLDNNIWYSWRQFDAMRIANGGSFTGLNSPSGNARFSVNNSGEWGVTVVGESGWRALGVAQGGTGAGNAAQARKNLNAPVGNMAVWIPGDRNVGEYIMEVGESGYYSCGDANTGTPAPNGGWWMFNFHCHQISSETSKPHYGVIRAMSMSGAQYYCILNDGVFGPWIPQPGSSRLNELTDSTNLSSANGNIKLYIKDDKDWGAWDSGLATAIPLPLSRGGTGATDRQTARGNLGVDRLVESDTETMLYAPGQPYRLTVRQNYEWGCWRDDNGTWAALSVAAGGTGANDAFAARKNLGLTEGSTYPNLNGRANIDTGILNNSTYCITPNKDTGTFPSAIYPGIGENWYILETRCHDDVLYRTQWAEVFTGAYRGAVFQRCCTGGTWSAWSIVSGGELNSLAKSAQENVTTFMTTGLITGSSGAVMAGNVDGGGWEQWRDRPAGMRLEVSNHSAAFNIWKAVMWGKGWIGGDDAVLWSDNGAEVRRHVVNADFSFIHNGYFSCTAVTQTSDYRMKANLQPIATAKDKVKQLQGYTYYKRQTMEETEGSFYSIEAGIIAQDLMEVLPEAVFPVKGNDDKEYYSVNYSGVTALLVNAIKETIDDIEALQTEVATLKDEVTALKTAVQQLLEAQINQISK